MSIESQLREALSARADEVGGPGGASDDPYARVAGAIAVNRRRRRTAALAGVAAVAAIAVAVPSLAGGLGRDTTTPAKRTQVVVPGPNDPRWAPVRTWPIRGSLADDRTFLDSFREVVSPAAVLYAGDIAADRVVVAWDRDDQGEARLTVYAGDRGAPVAALTTIGSSGETDPPAVIVRRDPTPDGWMLLLTRASVRSAQVSPTAQIHTDGTVARAWNTVNLRDGAAIVDLRGAPFSLTRVRVGGYDGGTTLPARPGTTHPDVEGFCGNCTGQDFLDHAVTGTSYDVATTLGLRTGDVETTTYFNGPADPTIVSALGLDAGTRSVSRRLYVGLTRLPGGQVLRSAYVGSVDAQGAGGSARVEDGVPVDAATADRQPFALSAENADRTATRIQVVAPGAARVQLVSDLPTLYPDTAKVALANGTTVLTTAAWPETGSPYRISTFDSSGALIGTWPMRLPGKDDPYDVAP